MQYIAEKDTTTRHKALVRFAHASGWCIVCHKQDKMAIRLVAHRMKMDIQMPLSYEEFIRGYYDPRKVHSFLIDSCESLLCVLSQQVPVYVMAEE